MGSSFLTIIILAVGVLGVGALVLGIWMLLRWKRATRVGLHPTCRGCGFDLSGLQLATQGAPVPCPECGIALVEKNLAVGDPKRSAFMLITGVCCVIAALGVFGLGARRAWAMLTTSLPTPILVLQSGIDRADGMGTVSELAGRVGTKRMTAAQATALVDRALDQQKNALVWTPTWGLIVENAHDAGLTSDAQWKQYIEVAARPFVDASSKVARGDALTIDVGVRNCRVSPKWQGIPAVSYKVVALIDEVQITGPQVGSGSFSVAPGGAAWSSYTGETSGVLPGERTLHIKVTSEVRDKPEDYAKPPRYTLQYALQQPITVLEKGLATHVMKTDAAMAEAMGKAITIDRLGLEDGYDRGVVHANYMVYFAGLPRGVGMDMFLRARQADGTMIERKIGSVAREAQQPQAKHGHGGGSDVKDPMPLVDAIRLTGGVADVVLRPNLDVAKSRPNLYEIWGDEIVIASQKVQIKLKDGASETAPASTK